VHAALSAEAGSRGARRWAFDPVGALWGWLGAPRLAWDGYSFDGYSFDTYSLDGYSFDGYSFDGYSFD
jgi:hypothetical protein